ncbi:MAG: single-stranded DNA-binding protein [Desulfobacterales bacterium RIFOXYA12_FULL_46_15]|nr:MAG: single-stranded DNA-binding protein [Desulfobacula sp. GWF2_41_7]OGR25006.1 MAG: single-stranded DNA-binding protein [Desulfobacterales bacterium RIFOXYA12_FULL_46_15]
MAGLNKVMLIGNLGRDPEIRYSQQGLAVVNFSIATSEQWTDKTSGDKQEKTEWHNIVVFGKQAETCEKYLSKGSQIYVEGKLQTSTYEKDGQTHYMTKVVASNFMFLGGKQDTKGGGSSGYQKSDPDPAGHYQGQTHPGMSGGQTSMPDDDIPF